VPPWPPPEKGDPCLDPWHSAEAANPEKRTAVLLSLALGFFGAHRFYLHQPWQGLCYILFCWTLVPLVMSLVDARRLARMSCSEFHEEFGSGKSTGSSARGLRTVVGKAPAREAKPRTPPGDTWAA
jgi:TM2 domain-containing membrane protein YozV